MVFVGRVNNVYLLWPATLALLLARRQNQVQILVAVIIFFTLLGPLSRGIGGTTIFPDYPTLNLPHTLISRLFFFTSVIVGRFLAFMDALAFGCLCAVLLNYKPGVLVSAAGSSA